ncbi:MAG: AmmeMemoRadiSam system radical SAM enzyme [Candidatus Omnitrophica bacterium]|nr:AmmeMemoRadiSam system radical SAM enzyme [Candidatus Omnitrophota bacterium]MCG2703372.1 AmmeMemoRadiSam system radical SAM enzyme [Candidatus Omnitrophota bacterium]
MLKEALLWERYMGTTVSCLLCMRKCIIDDGHAGWCQTRLNQNGVLYALTYGKVAAMSVSSIEKKPFYHFFPGSLWLSLGSIGCNFRCRGCQSWDLSHCDVKKSLGKTNYLSPEMVVKKAKQNGCKGIAFTYNEPTMWFEYTLDVFKLAKEAGMSTCYVTNGFMSPAALEMISPYLDGFCLDVKGAFMESCTRLADISDINIIFSNGSDAKRRHAMHVEVVTNIVPGYNSNEKEAKEIAVWIFAELGKDTPWHLTRFFPYGELKEVPPTSIGLLENLRKMGMKEGLYYVYIGNVPGHLAAYTYCQGCKKAIVKRKEYDEIDDRLVEGHCPYCNALIFGRFSF